MFFFTLYAIILVVFYMKENYAKKLEELISTLDYRPTLLLHSCCAPCSSYVISYLKDYFDITILYYNPNIYPFEEYLKRKEEQIRFIKNFDNVKFMDCDYDNDTYNDLIKGLENEPERGSRCTVCFELRLRNTAIKGMENDFQYFGTTLTVSPYKNSYLINKIGLALENEYGIKWLVSDFKKNDGYKKSILYSKEFNLYRQDYCGCIYSKIEREKKTRD